MSFTTISAVVLTKNEENNIGDCLRTVGWCDETVVIDDYSQDKTAEYAKSAGARVYRRKLNSNFAGQRNFGLEKARSEWVLFVDADERITKELASEILFLTKKKKQHYNGFFLRRTDIVWNKKFNYGEVGKAKRIRLGRRNSGLWSGRVHERWQVKGSVGTLKNEMLHHSHPSLKQFLKDVDNYTTIRSNELYEAGKSSSLFKIFFNPIAKFIQGYLLKLGVLDGKAGFVVSAMMSLHSFMVWSKLWILQRK